MAEVQSEARGQQRVAPKSSPKNNPEVADPALPKTAGLEVGRLMSAIGKIPKDIAIVDSNGATLEQISAGGERVLVQIKQMHGPGALEGETPKEVVAIMEKFLPRAQKQISAVLAELSKSGALKQVFLEGMTPGDAQEWAQRIGELNKLAPNFEEVAKLIKSNSATETKQILTGLEQVVGKNPTDQQRTLLRGLRGLLQYQELKELVDKDPVLKKVRDGSFALQGLEDKTLHEANLKIARKNPTATIDDPVLMAAMDARDKHIVDTFGSSKDRFRVAVLGGGHSLKKEVEEWNKSHPNNQIRLVEIEPKEVGEYMKSK